MNSIIDSIMNQNTGPKKSRSALIGMLRRHLIVEPETVFEAAFYRPKRFIRAFNSSSEFSSAASSVARRFSAKFFAK
jgi:hypothetical protein